MKARMQKIQYTFLFLALCLAMNSVKAQVLTQVRCPGEDIQIDLDATDPSTQWETSSDGMNYTDVAGVTSATYSPPAASLGDSTWFRVRAVVGGCTIYSDTVLILSSFTEVDAGLDSTYCQGTGYALGGNPTATGGSGFSYAWTPAAGLSSATDPNPVASPNATTNYTLTVTDALGCQVTDEVTATIIPIPHDTIEYVFSGTVQSFTFPQCVSQVRVEAWGAAGGAGSGTNAGTAGLGGYVEGDLVFDSSLGTGVSLFVGGVGQSGAAGGAGGFNGGGQGGTGTTIGGGGGGATDVRYGGQGLGDRFIIAAGGGGGGGASGGGLSSVLPGSGGDAGTSPNLGTQGGNTVVIPASCIALGGDPGVWNTTTTDPVPYSPSIGQVDCGCGPVGGFSSSSVETTFHSVGGTGGNGSSDGTCSSTGGGGGGGGAGYGSGGGGGGGRGENGAGNWPGAGGGGGASYFVPAVLNGTVDIPSSGGNQGSGSITIKY